MDYYDKAVAYLTERPGEIHVAWLKCGSHFAGALFSFVTPNRLDFPSRADGWICGCLTQISSIGDVAWTDELTEAIRADDRLPSLRSALTVEHLPVFAEWQRRIDSELGRTPPVWVEPEADNA